MGSAASSTSVSGESSTAVDPRGRHHDVLREAAVALAAEHVDGARVAVPSRRSSRGRPAPGCRPARRRAVRGDHAARHVAALHAREVERAEPARLAVRVVGGAVGALARPEVGVVAAGGGDAHQHLVGPGDGDRHAARLDDVEPAVAGDHRGSHALGQRRRGRLGRLRRSRGHGSSMAPRHGPGRSRAVDRRLVGSSTIDIL